jgi:hypothetical protein
MESNMTVRQRVGERARDAFIVDGMDCADEIREIEDRLGHLAGVDRLQFDLVRRRLLVEGSIAEGEVRRVIQTLGMRARLEGETAPPPAFWERHGRLVTAVMCGATLAVAGLLILRGVGDRITVPLLAISAVAAAGCTQAAGSNEPSGLHLRCSSSRLHVSWLEREKQRLPLDFRSGRLTRRFQRRFNPETYQLGLRQQ